MNAYDKLLKRDKTVKTKTRKRRAATDAPTNQGATPTQMIVTTTPSGNGKVGDQDREGPDQVTVEAPTGSGKSVYPVILSKYTTVVSDQDRMAMSPSSYGLNFPSWRTHQLETGYAVRDAFPMFIKGDRTVVLTRTKSLQAAYADFGAAVLFGRSNYECVHPQVDPQTRCDECMFAERGMHKCPCSVDCHYLIAKGAAMHADLACINYAYWMVAHRFKDSAIAHVVLDECHMLDGITLDASGVVINDRTRKEYNLPYFPIIKKGDSFDGQGKAMAWLENTMDQMRAVIATHAMRAKRGDKESAKEATRAEHIRTRIANAARALDSSQMAWFVRSGPGQTFYRGRQMPGIQVRPLTPRYHYKRLFFGSWNVTAMSATVGNFDAFNRSLGLSNTATIRVPNQWAPYTRPVHVLDTPAMNYKTSNSGKVKQARAIADAVLHTCPDTWSGIVHVTKKTEAYALRDKLAWMGLADRVWCTPEKDVFGYNLGTQEQVKLWHERLRSIPNSIAITWQLWEGYDGTDERICIVAKVPYPYLGDEYERERMEFSRKTYMQRAARRIAQAIGRTRRGRPGDYDSFDQINGFVAVADINVVRILSFLPLDILKAMFTTDQAIMAKIKKAIKKVQARST